MQSVWDQIGMVFCQVVYDVFSVFVDRGLICKIQLVGFLMCFENCVGDNYYYFICCSCGDMVDVDCVVGVLFCFEVVKDFGYEIDEVEIIFWGLCFDC